MPAPASDIRWVRYEPAASLLLVLPLSAAAELAHRRLADHFWHTGVWVANGPAAAAFCRVRESRWPRILAELARVGWRARRDELRNSWVHRVRAEAASALRLAQCTGRSGAERRWAKVRAQDSKPSPDGPPIAPPAGPPMPMNNTENSTSDTALKASELSKRSSSERKKAASGEKDFMERVGQVLASDGKKEGRDQLANWGGWWRNRFRENPDKARRVLAEVAGMAREGRIHTSAGGAAFDLWQRLP